MKKTILSLSLAIVSVFSQNTAVAGDSCDYTGGSHDVLADSFHSIGFTVCSTHFPAGSDARAAIDFALSRLNRVQGSDLYFYIAGTSSHKNYDNTLEEDGYNRIDITEEGCSGDDCSFSGRTIHYNNIWGNINEFDIALNEDITWNYGMPSSWSSDGTTYLRSLLLHEIGHGIGFDHGSGDSSDLTIMGSLMGKWSANKDIDIKAYDHGHMRYHYSDGSSNLLPDLVISNYNLSYDSTDGSYSCELNEGVSSTSISRGSSFTLSWTRMNTGPKDVTTSYNSGVYLSTDETLSSDDTLIKTIAMTTSVPANSTHYLDETVTIPSTAKLGNFFVIMKLDKDNVISEQFDSNNIMPIHTQITVK